MSGDNRLCEQSQIQPSNDWSGGSGPDRRGGTSARTNRLGGCREPARFTRVLARALEQLKECGFAFPKLARDNFEPIINIISEEFFVNVSPSLQRPLRISCCGLVVVVELPHL